MVWLSVSYKSNQIKGQKTMPSDRLRMNMLKDIHEHMRPPHSMGDYDALKDYILHETTVGSALLPSPAYQLVVRFHNNWGVSVVTEHNDPTRYSIALLKHMSLSPTDTVKSPLDKGRWTVHDMAHTPTGDYNIRTERSIEDLYIAARSCGAIAAHMREHDGVMP